MLRLAVADILGVGVEILFFGTYCAVYAAPATCRWLDSRVFQADILSCFLYAFGFSSTNELWTSWSQLLRLHPTFFPQHALSWTSKEWQVRSSPNQTHLPLSHMWLVTLVILDTLLHYLLLMWVLKAHWATYVCLRTILTPRASANFLLVDPRSGLCSCASPLCCS